MYPVYRPTSTLREFKYFEAVRRRRGRFRQLVILCVVNVDERMEKASPKLKIQNTFNFKAL